MRERLDSDLRTLLAELSDMQLGEDDGDNLASMSHEEMFELIDEEFGA